MGISEEHRNKLSESHRGQIPWNKGKFGYKMPPASEERKNKIGAANRGRKFSGEKLANIARAVKYNALGAKRTPEQRVEISKRLKGKPQFHLRGDKNHLWKGGITPLTQKIRHCFKYRQWRSDCFERDDYTCQFCGTRGGYLEVDHHPKTFSIIFHNNKIKLFEEALNCEELWNINNGRTLCKKCHNKTKGYVSTHI